jgi:hypothetical protein
MMALMVLIGDDELDMNELRLLDIMELLEVEEERRRDVRRLEKEEEMYWKREERISLTQEGRDWGWCGWRKSEIEVSRSRFRG